LPLQHGIRDVAHAAVRDAPLSIGATPIQSAMASSVGGIFEAKNLRGSEKSE
jgi:hypothetical protein